MQTQINQSIKPKRSWLIKITHVNHSTGSVTERTLKRRYRTEGLARAIADRLGFICRPDGYHIKSECVAVVIPCQGGAA